MIHSLEHMIYCGTKGAELGRDIPGSFGIMFRLGLSCCGRGHSSDLVLDNECDEFVVELFEEINLMDWFQQPTDNGQC